MSSHPPQYSQYSLPPPMQDRVSLPSIKDLNFPPPGQDGAPTNPSGRSDHNRPRHESTSWSRPTASSGHPPPSQHSPSMPPPHEPPPGSRQYTGPSKPDSPYTSNGPSPQQPPAGVPTHNGVNAGASRPENATDPSSKKSRSQSGVSASPGRTPHTSYAPYPPQAPPPGYHHQGPPPPTGPPPQEHLQQPPPFTHAPPPPGYAPYPPPIPPRHYMQHPPAPSHHQGQPPPSSYPPPPGEHWQHQAPQQQQQQQPPPQLFNGYAPRTTPLVPANVETRASAPNPADVERASARHHLIAEILKHCSMLYGFANHYATHPQMQPGPPEIEEMNYRASNVVRLLEELRRLDSGEDVSRKEGGYPTSATPVEETPRPPKRPWEDMTRDGEPSSAVSYDAQSTAEQDMQIIRNKRQSSTGGAVPGQQKNKYRKRSRATPPGKCHSCNIRETPEWRRGPDGARTLCNACGLHYAKLMRKRDKTLDANGKAPPIDLQTLRASTASARGAGSGGDHGGEPPQTHPPPHQGQPPPSPYDQPKQPPMHAGPPPHPGPYQLMPVGGPSPPGGQLHQLMPPPPHAPGSAPHSAAGGPVPPPPWLATSGAGERAAYNTEPQSYVRASHPPSHARASPQ